MTNHDNEAANADAGSAVSAPASGPIADALREGARRSRPVRHVVRRVGVLGLVVIAGIGAYFAGRVQGFDEGRAATVLAASPSQPATALTGSNVTPPVGTTAEAIIPASELVDLYGPPRPATPTAVAARARELCHATGGGDRDISVAELVEMATGQIAAYDAVAKHGGKLSAEDKRCYHEAEATLAEDQKDRAEADQP